MEIILLRKVEQKVDSHIIQSVIYLARPIGDTLTLFYSIKK